MQPKFFNLFFFLPLFSYCQQNDVFSGGRLSSLANAGVSLSDVWSAQSNQAGLAEIKATSFGLGYENRFLLKELSTNACVLALPFRGNVFALSFNHFGYRLYNRQKAGVSYARSFGAKVNAGMSISYHSLKIEDYGYAGTVTVEGGMQYHLTKRSTIGFHIFNPNHSKLSTDLTKTLPSSLSLGYAHLFSDKVLLALQADKNIEFAPELKVAMEYKLAKLLHIRGGYAVGEELTGSFGFRLAFSKFYLNASSSFHQVLGYSPQFSIEYEL